MAFRFSQVRSILNRSSNRLAVASLLMLLLLTACASLQNTQASPPPVLAQDEVFRPYVKVGTVEVFGKRFAHPDDIKDEIGEWAHDALSTEAAKVGADAVIFPEIHTEKSSFLFIPVTTINARGIAIKFR